MTQKRRAVVICPGRGTYNRQELGYLTHYHQSHQASELLSRFDQTRQSVGLTSLTALDTAPLFKSREHLEALNAAPLIYSCSFLDYQALNTESLDVVAVTGNSMGWYTALACAGAITPEQGLELVTQMAKLTSGEDLGGQLIYPLVDEQWRPSVEHIARVQALLAEPVAEAQRLHRSIVFGGYVVLAGSHQAIQRAQAALPKVEDKFPLVLPGHNAFHTPLMQAASQRGFDYFSVNEFSAPELPLVDGTGRIWSPKGTQASALRDYTLGHQVTETYDFSAAVRVAVREFAPDVLILLGPGTTMGGAVAQTLIPMGWRAIWSKSDFAAVQQSQPVIWAMGLETQRALAVADESSK
ncbi:MAG: ACP S-malonyltransferase [Idiomarina sp.]|nr:ACP S-malonyltransferase [Idiomarina sp.]